MIVLDTHILVWMIQGDSRLSEKARRTIATAAAEGSATVPAICIWEIELLVSRNKILLPFETGDWVRKTFSATGLKLTPLEPEIAIEAARLDWNHKDPADRMIVATARYRQARLLTADKTILAFAARGGCDAFEAGR